MNEGRIFQEAQPWYLGKGVSSEQRADGVTVVGPETFAGIVAAYLGRLRDAAAQARLRRTRTGGSYPEDNRFDHRRDPVGLRGTAGNRKRP